MATEGWLLGSVVASAFHKLPPFESQTLLAYILNRGHDSQAPGAEKCDWYVLAARASMHWICRVRLPPNVSLKWLRFDDLRRSFSIANTDSWPRVPANCCPCPRTM